MLQKIVASNDGIPNHLAFNAKEPLIIVGDSKVRMMMMMMMIIVGDSKVRILFFEFEEEEAL